MKTNPDIREWQGAILDGVLSSKVVAAKFEDIILGIIMEHDHCTREEALAERKQALEEMKQRQLAEFDPGI